jgi:hypothetical protein
MCVVEKLVKLFREGQLVSERKFGEGRAWTMALVQTRHRLKPVAVCAVPMRSYVQVKDLDLYAVERSCTRPSRVPVGRLSKIAMLVSSASGDRPRKDLIINVSNVAV